MKQAWNTKAHTSAFAAGISLIPDGRMRAPSAPSGRRAARCFSRQAGNQQELYLHPMNFSGVIQTDEIPRLQALLAGAQTFQCQGVDCYERYWDLTDAAYLERLEAQREEIIEAILERYQTKRKNLYVTGPAERSIVKQFSVHRLCDKDGKNNLANRYVGELVEQLIQEGQLVTAETRNGRGIRTAIGTELRQREEPLLGQQQMTL